MAALTLAGAAGFQLGADMKGAFILVSMATLALATPALAADLAQSYPVKAAPAPDPVFSWTGFYGGVNGSYAGGKAQIDMISATPYSWGLNASGYALGGQVGYNYQFANNVVVGAEADLQWADINGQTITTAAGSVQGTFGGSIDYFGTLRARAGYAFGRVLPYVTGGAAYGKMSYTFTSVNLAQPANSYDLSQSTTQWGWTLGAGLEMALTERWTVKAEYLYVDLGTMDVTTGSSPRTLSLPFNDLKMAVNYKF